jgi:hypothetical protein
MASLTTANNSGSASPTEGPPPVPSRDHASYRKASERTLKQRKLVRQREDNSPTLEENFADLHIASVDVSGDDEEVNDTDNSKGKTIKNTKRQNNEKEEQGEEKDGIPSAELFDRRLKTAKSLASFQSVDDAVNHAIDKGVTLPEAFQQLHYRNSQVYIVNHGILRKSDSVTSKVKNGDLTSFLSPNDTTSKQKKTKCFSVTRSNSTGTSSNTKKTNCMRKTISSPSAVKHQTHVHFNHDLCKYEGLPEEQAKVANQQFGVPLITVPKRKLDQYTSKIPSVLVLLWNNVLKRNGEKCKGIFRLAADAEEMSYIKENINTGKYDGSEIEENVAATLIKIFFRQLPINLLNHLDKSIIEKIANNDKMLKYEGSVVSDDSAMVVATDKEAETAQKILNILEREGFSDKLHYSLFLWLLDIMCTVVEHKDVNKMTAKNMAIVVAPNLYSIEDMSNPMEAMSWTQRIARFLEVVLLAKIASRSVKRRESLKAEL